MKQEYDQIMLDEYSFKKVGVRLCLREGDPYYSAEPISSPDQAVNIMGQLMKDLDREMDWKKSVPFRKIRGRFFPIILKRTNVGVYYNVVVVLQRLLIVCRRGPSYLDI